MLGRLFLLFVIVPLLDLAILIRLGGLAGFWPTFALVLLTGALGALLARRQGGRVLRRIRAEMAVGQVPARPLLDGLLVLVGGLLLLMPGLLTDAAGLLLLVPGVRRRAHDLLRRRMEGMVRSGRVGVALIRP